MKVIAVLLVASAFPAVPASAAAVCASHVSTATMTIPVMGLLPVVSAVREEDGVGLVARIMLMNGPNEPTANIPCHLDAILRVRGRDIRVQLLRRGPPQRVLPGHWTGVDYGMERPAGVEGPAVLSLDGVEEGYSFALSASETHQLATTAPSTELAPAPPPATRAVGTQSKSALANLTAYQPVYFVVGKNTSSDVSIQLSFKYQIFGRAGEAGGSWLNGFHFAYTQRMFWDTGHNSQPFRDTSYEPELLYIYTRPLNDNGVWAGARGGVLHESNGKGGWASRAYQYVYLQPQLDFPIGSYTVSIGPRFFHYVLGRDNNQDIARYRGHQALALSTGRDDGLKLSTYGRYNFSTGKGSMDGTLSYPLRRLIGRTPLYLVVQGFTGYGEDLLDYNRKQTRVRAGLGIVR